MAGSRRVRTFLTCSIKKTQEDDVLFSEASSAPEQLSSQHVEGAIMKEKPFLVYGLNVAFHWDINKLYSFTTK